MKIVLTGSLGHIGKPLAQELIQKGHQVTVISSNPAKQTEIGSLGATAAIGNIEDVEFLTAAFTGADAVYCLFAPGGFFDPNYDLMAKITQWANTYKQAIARSGVKKVVHLSSIGAHTDKHNGILAFHYKAEQILRELPSDVSIKHLRPVGFYYNLLGFIPGIKATGVIASNYGGDQPKPWVAPVDIAAVAAEELTGPFNGRTVRYIASEEISSTEIAHILGAAIGKPDLQWVVIPGKDLLDRLTGIGMNPAIAKGLVEMQDSIQSGELYEDYYRHHPASLGKTKVKDFAPEFAGAYQQS
ncbi:MAG TPA: NAD(P)H-binding protein [Puia sp.]|jgi:uncharacterized protein YbjT (DUF2867 family)|nr:NAD(P)H-binding protein [Puia sp.]